MCAKDHIGTTAFAYACIKGHTDVVKLLLDQSETKGIELNAIHHSKHSVFAVACRNGHTDVVKILLEQSYAKNIELEPKNKVLQK